MSKDLTKFRPHRHLLSESLAEAIEIKDHSELVGHLKKVWSHWPTSEGFESKDVTVEKYGNGIDERCGWDTHIVCIKGDAVGFTDGPL